ATFTVPGTNVASFSDGAAQHLPPETAPETRLPVFERVLVVEDNMIIALDAEMIMSDLGSAQVDIAASVGQAQDLLQLHQYDFALLDVNLGDQTSEKIADILVERSQPFVFATGYGELRELEGKYKDVPVVQKPYEKDDLVEAIATFGLGEN
ncbi:MAG: response regulator, partial [Pseudomonadota bacterium]